MVFEPLELLQSLFTYSQKMCTNPSIYLPLDLYTGFSNPEGLPSRFTITIPFKQFCSQGSRNLKLIKRSLKMKPSFSVCYGGKTKHWQLSGKKERGKNIPNRKPQRSFPLQSFLLLSIPLNLAPGDLPLQNLIYR